MKALAREMGTSDRGTSLDGLARAMRRRGIAARGLAVTEAGLRTVPLPCVALVAPAHLVLLEELGPTGARVWDPSAGGLGKPGVRQHTPEEWRQGFRGIVLQMR